MGGSSVRNLSALADAARTLGNEKRLTILETLCQMEPGLGLSKIARMLEIAPAAADRHLRQLKKHTGFVRKFAPVRRDLQTRPIWAVGNPERVRAILAVLEDLHRHAEVGLLLAELEECTRTLPWEREHEAQLRRLLGRARDYWSMLSDEEKKKVEIWERFIGNR